jgi:SAM-dependent methyltransferase
MQEMRIKNLIKNLDLSKTGLEVSPLYRPTVKKTNGNVYYTDYCSAEESRRKHANYEHEEIMDIDFVWTPGKDLSSCILNGLKFDWAISSHVLEHVPNPIGWLLEVFEVMKVGGIFSIALPDKRFCYDKFRRETDAADLIDAWIRNQSIPSPYQLFDFLSRSVDGSGEYGCRSFDLANEFQDAKRHYTDKDALNYVMHSWKNGQYYDVHCSAFTPESFMAVFKQINNLGILNCEITEIVQGHEEFFVQVKKLGDPSIDHPGQSYNEETITKHDLIHARNAFQEAVKIQNELKNELENYIKLKSKYPAWMRRFIF